MPPTSAVRDVIVATVPCHSTGPYRRRLHARASLRIVDRRQRRGLGEFAFWQTDPLQGPPASGTDRKRANRRANSPTEGRRQPTASQPRPFAPLSPTLLHPLFPAAATTISSPTRMLPHSANTLLSNACPAPAPNHPTALECNNSPRSRPVVDDVCTCHGPVNSTSSPQQPYRTGSAAGSARAGGSDTTMAYPLRRYPMHAQTHLPQLYLSL